MKDAALWLFLFGGNMNTLKTVKPSWISLLVFNFLFLPFAFAENIRFEGGYHSGRIKIVGDGFRGGKDYQVNIYVNGNFKTSTSITSGSFSEVVNRIDPGDSIKVSVLQYYGGSNHFNRTLTVPGSSEPDPWPPFPPNPPNPPNNGYHGDIGAYANQQARTVANRVAETYGKRENWRYNFVRGFWHGLDQIRGSFSQYFEYRQGKEEGAREAETAGYQAGARRADEIQGPLAKAEVRKRYLSIVDTHESVDTREPDLLEDGFSGITGNAPSTHSGDYYVSELESSFASELRGLRFSYDGYDLDYSDWGLSWNLRNIYDLSGSSSYRWYDDWTSGSFAFDVWRNGRMGGRYDYNPWEKMNSSQRNSYERQFKSVYEDVIGEKYSRVRDRHNSSAYSSGESYGVRVGRKEARDRGYNEGYTGGFREASTRGYRENYQRAYNETFRKEVRYYESRPVIEIESARLTDANQNGILEPGEQIGVILQSVVNIGRVDAQGLPVRLLGESVLAGASQGISIPASTRVREATELPTLGQMRSTIQTGVTYRIVLSVSDENKYEFSAVLDWGKILQGFEEEKDLKQLQDFVIENIRKEWLNCVANGGNWYKNGLPNGARTKLEELVNFSKQANSQAQRGIRSIKRQIQNAQATGGAHPFLRKAFARLADQL